MVKFKNHHYVFFVHTVVAIVLQSTKLAMVAMDKKYVVMTLELYHHYYPCFYAFWYVIPTSFSIFVYLLYIIIMIFNVCPSVRPQREFTRSLSTSPEKLLSLLFI